jgi:hypothetical protein
VKFVLILSILLCQTAGAQFMRKYIFAAPTLTEGPAANSVSTGFGVLPPPTPLVSSTATGNNSYTGGGGFEQLFGKHWGAGVDFAAIFPGQGKVFSNTLGAISPNGYFHLNSTATSDLFVTGGYTVLFNDFTANAVNFGVGWNYWFHENLGFTIEGRTILVPDYKWPKPPNQYYTEIRFGFAFR